MTTYTQVTIDIDDALLFRLMLTAHEQDKTLNDLIRGILNSLNAVTEPSIHEEPQSAKTEPNVIPLVTAPVVPEQYIPVFDDKPRYIFDNCGPIDPEIDRGFYRRSKEQIIRYHQEQREKALRDAAPTSSHSHSVSLEF